MGRSERGNGCVGRTARQKRPRAGRDVGRQVDHDVVTRDSPANRDGVEQIDVDSRGAGALEPARFSGERATAVTRCPAAMSCGTTRLPITPVAPLTNTLLLIALLYSLLLPSGAASRGRTDPAFSRRAKLVAWV